MAEIHLAATTVGCGPHIADDFGAIVRLDPIFGDDKPNVPVLWLLIGADSIRIWPFEPDRIEEFARRLCELATAERERRAQR